MKEVYPHINLVSAWIGLLLGFVSGALMGLKFHQPDWLGGYASFPRRMIRLGHISFFGLGMVNLMFYFVTRSLPPFGPALVAGSSSARSPCPSAARSCSGAPAGETPSSCLS